MRWLLGLMVCLSHAVSSASELTHRPVRRVTVFPFAVPSDLEEAAETVWWEVRKLLTNTEQFLVASRNFMVQKDVMQPRGALEPADILVLGRFLDAHALLTLAVQGNEMRLQVYDGRTGQTLWQQGQLLDRAVPRQNQLSAIAMTLTQNFIKGFPYSGFLLKPATRSRLVVKEKGDSFVDAFVGSVGRYQVGDKMQIFRLKSVSLEPLFEDGGSQQVLAEAVVSRIDEDSVRLRLESLRQGISLREDDLVEAAGAPEANLPTLVMTEAARPNRQDPQKQATRQRAAALSFLGSLALIFVLAL